MKCPDCGRGWWACFVSGVIKRFVICACGKKCATSGATKQTERCGGCKRPFVGKNLKACTYCGRPNQNYVRPKVLLKDMLSKKYPFSNL